MVNQLRRPSLCQSSKEPPVPRRASKLKKALSVAGSSFSRAMQSTRAMPSDSRTLNQASPARPDVPSWPTLVRRMTSGTLESDDSIRLDEERQPQPTERSFLSSNPQSPSSRRRLPDYENYDSNGLSPEPSTISGSMKSALVKKPSNCESLEDTYVETSSFSSSEDPVLVHVRKLRREPWQSAAAQTTNNPEAWKTQEIFAYLSEEDKETAARTSWEYFCQFADKKRGEVDLCRRDALARALIDRHLAGEGGDVQIARQKVHNTLQGRREQKLDWVRQCWHQCPDWSQEQQEFSEFVRTKMSRWLGPHGRVCLLDYDEEGRCNYYHKLAIWTEGTRYDREAILYVCSYMVEKALACTERRSQGQQNRVNVVLDFRDANMRDKNQTLPISIGLEVVELMKDHYPDRVWTITMIDAPFLARFAWPIFRPFINHIVQGGVKFVTGKRQILRTFGPKMLHYDRANNLDMDKFFQLPFDHAYEEVHGNELEY